MKNKIFILILLLSCTLHLFAQKIVVRGRVTDALTGEILSDANIADRKSGSGVSSNAYGLYSITLKEGVCVLQCSMLGYITQADTLRLTVNRVVDFALKPDTYLLESVEVTGNQKHAGQFSLEQKDIQALPVMGGEPDLMKTLQFLPGVVSGNEGTNNISVRGGDQWGNLVLMDEAVIYNPNHALSFFSIFNSDAIQKVNLYKSYFPLNYGGRTSSVIDVRMREGNRKNRQISGSLGLMASKLMMEGPLKDGKTSYLVSARVAYPGLALKVLDEPGKMTFYDINAKVNRTIDDENRIYFSVYNGGDHTEYDKLVRGFGMSWGNTTATFRWNRVINEKMYSNLTGVFSNYYYRYKSLEDGLSYLWKSNMQSYQLKYDLEYLYDNQLKIKAGGAAHFFSTTPGSVSRWGESSNIVPYRMDRRRMLDVAFYGEAEYRFAPRWQLNAGVRLSTLYAPGTAFYKAKTFVLPEPRAELSYRLNTNNRVSASFNRSSQNLHMLSNSSVGLPSDMWIPVNAKLKPVTMRQYAVAYEWNSPRRSYTASVEAYYRKSNRIIDYIDNADIFLNDRIEEMIESGSSRAYGVELYLSKNRGALTGWASYTLSKARNRLKGIQDSEYRPVYDRPHNLKLFLNYRFNDHWSLSSTFSYCSGMNLTIPVGKYEYQEAVYYIYSARNGYRAPAFHQLDLAGTYHFRKGSLTLSAINAYNRKNVFTIYTGRVGYADLTEMSVYKMYLYGVVPSLTYSFKF